MRSKQMRFVDASWFVVKFLGIASELFLFGAGDKNHTIYANSQSAKQCECICRTKAITFVTFSKVHYSYVSLFAYIAFTALIPLF